MSIEKLKIEKFKSGSFFIKVFGCQYNEWDAARLSFLLKNCGLTESTIDDADFVFLLNCSVRKSAVDRTYGAVKNLIAAGKKVIITGCILDSDRKKFETKGCLIWDGQSIQSLEKDLNLPLECPQTPDFLPQTNFIPIMKGCNNFCSYCAVPYTRGRETSRPMDEILKDVGEMVTAGQKEILLIGQNVNSYKNFNESISNEARKDFAILLEKINSIPGDFTVSFTSNHPKDMTDDIIEAIATLPKIAKAIHLPIQSGSNKILKAMNRPYTREQYLDLIKKIKLMIPEVKITTDVIVGFPGETDEDFDQTVDIFNQVGYFQAYINKYSPRSGTVAFKLGDPIPWSEKERRWKVLDKIIYKK